jgi:hypothetical protein
MNCHKITSVFLGSSGCFLYRLFVTYRWYALLKQSQNQLGITIENYTL